jgi:hypothetical protein
MSRIVMPFASGQIRGVAPVETTPAVVISALSNPFDYTEGVPGDPVQHRSSLDSASAPE